MNERKGRDGKIHKNNRTKSLKTKYLNIKFYCVYTSAILRNYTKEKFKDEGENANTAQQYMS